MGTSSDSNARRYGHVVIDDDVVGQYDLRHDTYVSSHHDVRSENCLRQEDRALANHTGRPYDGGRMNDGGEPLRSDLDPFDYLASSRVSVGTSDAHAEPCLRIVRQRIHGPEHWNSPEALAAELRTIIQKA